MEFIHQTNVGLYLVLLFGLAALTVAVRQVMAPESNRVLTASWLLALTGLAGLLGTVAGVQQSARQFGAHTEIWLFSQDLHRSTET